MIRDFWRSGNPVIYLLAVLSIALLIKKAMAVKDDRDYQFAWEKIMRYCRKTYFSWDPAQIFFKQTEETYFFKVMLQLKDQDPKRLLFEFNRRSYVLRVYELVDEAF